MRSVHSSQYRALLKRLRQARLEAGLTQSQVAQEVGRPQSFVSKSESGERRLDPIELLEFARVYGRPLAHLLPNAPGADGDGASLVAESAGRFGPRTKVARRGRASAGSRRRRGARTPR